MEKNITDNTYVLTMNGLLEGEAKLLKELCVIEINGNFSPMLLAAETRLLHFFENPYSPKNIYENYSQETINFARCIAERPNTRKQLSSIIENDDAKALQRIVMLNPFMLNTYDSAKKTPLHASVGLEKRQCISTLLQLKANPNCLNDQNCSPLHMAAKRNAPIDIVIALLSAGANPDIKNQNGNTAFDIACLRNSPNVKAFEPYGYLFFSSLWPYKNPFLLLKDDALYLEELNKEPLGSYEWQHAEQALKIFFSHIEKYTLESPSIKSKAFVTKNDLTLCHASLDDCAELFKDTSLKDMENMIKKTANLIIYKKEVKKILLTSAQTNDYKKLHDLLNHCIVSGSLQYAILKVCIKNNSHECLSVCLDHEFNPNRYHKQQSLLHYATDCNNLQAIELLSEHNADLTILNQLGQTPLEYAVALQKTECMKTMTTAIEHRKNSLIIHQGYCGLSKHIFGEYKTSGFCGECLCVLGWQLQYPNFKDSAL